MILIYGEFRNNFILAKKKPKQFFCVCGKIKLTKQYKMRTSPIDYDQRKASIIVKSSLFFLKKKKMCEKILKRISLA